MRFSCPLFAKIVAVYRFASSKYCQFVSSTGFVASERMSLEPMFGLFNNLFGYQIATVKIVHACRFNPCTLSLSIICLLWGKMVFVFRYKLISFACLLYKLIFVSVPLWHNHLWKGLYLKLSGLYYSSLKKYVMKIYWYTLVCGVHALHQILFDKFFVGLVSQKETKRAQGGRIFHIEKRLN